MLSPALGWMAWDCGAEPMGPLDQPSKNKQPARSLAALSGRAAQGAELIFRV
jgi:hypothetical protein